MSPRHCDVAVLGAGPGGALAASICAARGLDIVVLERGELRGTHLPESWVGGAEALLDGLSALDGHGVGGWRDALRSETTVVLRSASSGQSVSITVRAGVGGEGVRLDRVILDAVLLDRARNAGATVLTGVNVVNVVPPRARAEAVVQAVTREGEQVVVSAPIVLDASGKSAVLGRQLGLLDVGDTDLDPREAAFTHVRPERPSALTTPGTMTVTGTPFGYVFVIPIDEGRVSVGVVSASSNGTVGAAAAGLLDTGLAGVPDVAQLVASGTRLLPVIRAMNRTYRCRAVAADWYALIGDAAAFIDPFCCAGLDVALHSGALAADLATTMLAAPEPARAQASRTYREELTGLLARTGHRAVLPDAAHELLNALTDPHLPPLLPLAAHARGRHPGSDATGCHAALAAGRRSFAAVAHPVARLTTQGATT
jgi:flavin-dependent dehydrogenase